MAGISSISFIQFAVSGLIHQYFIAFIVSTFLVYMVFVLSNKFCILKTQKNWRKLLKGSSMFVLLVVSMRRKLLSLLMTTESISTQRNLERALYSSQS